MDEEFSCFYNQHYGLLVVFNNGCMALISSFEYDEISKILVDSIVNDRTGFYLKNLPSLPPYAEKIVLNIDE